ncbi:35064_t:CDS:2, partial [Gigaspora margarita]
WVKKEFKLDIHLSTIGRLIKNKDDIENNLTTKRQRTVQLLEAENALLKWILQNQKRVILSWLYKFKQRHKLGWIKKHGEDASVDNAIVVATIPHFEPDTTLVTKCLKEKKDLEWLTLALCANTNGTDKRKIFIIGKSSNPHCFKEVNHNRLGIKYNASKKAWMTMILFQKWLEEFDLKMASHKIIFLLDAEKDEKINVLGILSDAQDNEESFIDENNDELIDELYQILRCLTF